VPGAVAQGVRPTHAAADEPLGDAAGHQRDLRGDGKEKARWARDDGALSYSIAAVLASRPNDRVRMGVDLGGGGSSNSYSHVRGADARARGHRGDRGRQRRRAA
jgi:hypothetical protein